MGAGLLICSEGPSLRGVAFVRVRSSELPERDRRLLLDRSKARDCAQTRKRGLPICSGGRRVVAAASSQSCVAAVAARPR